MTTPNPLHNFEIRALEAVPSVLKEVDQDHDIKIKNHLTSLDIEILARETILDVVYDRTTKTTGLVRKWYCTPLRQFKNWLSSALIEEVK